jgi:hypothetical protein
MPPIAVIAEPITNFDQHMRERRQLESCDAVMAPILGPDGQALAAHGWDDTESIADDGGTLC